MQNTLRLPGIYFQSAPPTQAQPLPPLDVAAFVGYAERGPLHLPVPVEDLQGYHAIFGGDLALAQDVGGRVVYANLPATVRAFFGNGGRRCYVVRVAGEEDEAIRSRFRLPGVVALNTESGEPRGLATVNAAWVGAWSGKLQLACQLRVTPMPASTFEVKDNSPTLEWQSHSAPDSVQPGDVLQLTLVGETWLFPVSSREAVSTGSSTRYLRTRRAWRLIEELNGSPQPIITEISRLGLDGNETLAVGATLDESGRGLILSLEGADAAQVRRGDVLRLLVDGVPHLFPVEEVGQRAQSVVGVMTSPPAASIQVQGGALLALDEATLPTDQPRPDRVNRLRFDLHLRQESVKCPSLDELGFNDGQPRFWGDAVYLTSSALYQQSAEMADRTLLAEVAAEYRALRDETSLPNGPTLEALSALLAPLDREAETTAARPTYLPLGMPVLISEEDYAGVDEDDARTPPVTQLGNDGLDRYNPRLCLDEDLVLKPGTRRHLLLEAAFDRYFRQKTRLHGLHSLTFVDDVALIALPDAVHRTWGVSGASSPPPAAYEPWEMTPFDGSNFLICQGAPTVHEITPAQGSEAGGTMVTIEGSGFTDSYRTEVHFDSLLAQEVRVTNPTTLTAVTPPGTGIGPVSVTVRNWNGTGTLLDGFDYTPAPESDLPLLEPVSAYDEGPLLDVQRSLLDFCQARTDVVAILSLPNHYTHHTCIEWLENLREVMGLPRRPVTPDERHEIVDLSYAAVYHPWLLMRNPNASEDLRLVPPEGAVCGQIAVREREGGVWLAPANRPVVGALALDPTFTQEQWMELFALNFNLIRREFGAFRPLSAHTLSEERILLQLSVRRLMILLRKVAHERGMDYVFESNDEAFRLGVRFALEEMLERMYEQGAFQGASPAQAFHVSTDTPKQAVERGEFIAQIQVAPAQPLEFISVLMLLVDQTMLQTVEA